MDFQEEKFFHYSNSMASEVKMTREGMFDQSIRRELGERQQILSKREAQQKKHPSVTEGNWMDCEFIF